MLSVWSCYQTAIINHQCPIFGFFSKDLIIPSQELCAAVNVSCVGELPEKTHKIDFTKLAAELSVTENTVTSLIKQMLATIINILTKRRPFAVIKLSMANRTL